MFSSLLSKKLLPGVESLSQAELSGPEIEPSPPGAIVGSYPEARRPSSASETKPASILAPSGSLVKVGSNSGSATKSALSRQESVENSTKSALAKQGSTGIPKKTASFRLAGFGSSRGKGGIGEVVQMNTKEPNFPGTDYDEDDRFVQDLRRAFDLFDKDGSGRISPHELARVMRSLGQNPTRQEITEMMSGFDDNADGEIDFDEFVSLYAGSMNSADDEEFIAWAFEAFDKDKSGKLSADEIRDVIRCMGDELTEEEVAEIMDHGDLDGDGLLSFQEFTRLIIGD